MSLEMQAIRVLDQWYDDLDLYQDGLPSKGSIAAALHVLKRLRTRYDLGIDSHVSRLKAQIAGLSSKALKAVLAEFGETRRLSSVAGRSNRGARGDLETLLSAMKPLSLDKKAEGVRDSVLRAMQQHIVASYIPRHFAAKRVKAAFDRNATTCRFIRSLLENAKQSGKAGAVAEYLVGAKLSLRFPGKEIRNKRFSTSDIQSGFSGDFQVGNTAFHVTVAPMPELFEKCKGNLENGLRVYLIVPRNHVAGARQNAELLAADQIAVVSIESFVATNIDELSEFDGDRLRSGLRRLLETYNSRVDQVELDKSMLIDLPPNLD